MKRAIYVLLVPILVLSVAAAPDLRDDADSYRICQVDPDGNLYYAIELVGTKRVAGARMAKGTGSISFAPSPFGVAISPGGTYVYDIDIEMSNMTAPEGKEFVIWVTTPSLDQIRRIGALDESLRISGRVNWNKFLVVVSLEPAGATDAEQWTGPIVSRGMSRSGLMHTMAGHGPFQTEPCAVYGYS